LFIGRVNTEDMEEVSGTIEIPNLSEEQDICDIEVDYYYCYYYY